MARRKKSRYSGRKPALGFIKELQRLFPRMVDVLPEQCRGDVEICHFSISRQEAEINSAARLELWLPGRYCQLKVGGVGYMNDVIEERLFNREVVRKARGEVLITGLGLGMILHPILPNPEVTRVKVLEINQNVVDLVLPSLAPVPGFEKLEVALCDADHWTPAEGERFDTIWLDTLPFYSWDRRWLKLAEDAIGRYRPFLREGGWIGHWAFMEVLQEQLDREYEPEPKTNIAHELLKAHPLKNKLGIFDVALVDGSWQLLENDEERSVT